MPTGSVYLIKNVVSGRSYVGLTSKSVDVRWKQHLSSARRGDGLPLYCAIRKYGKESFEVSTLEVCNIDDIGIVEAKWIMSLKTLASENGYNIHPGGNGCRGSAPEEMRKKISISLMGHVTSEETKQKISDSLRGRPLSNDTKRKISEGLARPESVMSRSISSSKHRHTEESKTKISDALKIMWQDEAFKTSMSKKRTGENNSRSIMSEQDVIRIRTEWASTGDPKRTVDRAFCDKHAVTTGASAAAIFRMLRGHSWKHVILTMQDTRRDNHANNPW